MSECSAVWSFSNWPVDAYDNEVSDDSYTIFPQNVDNFLHFKRICAINGVVVRLRERCAAMLPPYRNISPPMREDLNYTSRLTAIGRDERTLPWALRA